MRKKHHLSALAALAVAVLSIPAAAFAQDPNDPETERASFELPEGFEATLFASEKDGIIKPIQMRWDERGRLWVIGSKTYPQIAPGEEPDDKVWILEDTDGDGRSDKTTVFADGLMIPTGLEMAAGGTGAAAAYIGEGTKLWLMTDTDGDGRADQKEVVLRGFGTGDNHQNINSFRWSPAGELMFCQGLHAFSRVETAHGIVKLDEAGLWRWRPREGRLDAFFGGAADPQNPWGWVFTEWGFPIVVAGNNGTMYYPLPEMIRGVQHGRRDSIWKDGRGRKTSGPEIIESSAFPKEWQGAMVAGGYINHAVWTFKVEDDGAGFKVTDHPTLPPLIRSKHGAFRPVDAKLGPDGALYVCDWYNPIIGHYQASFRHPDRDKAHGRIWRVAPKGAVVLKQPVPADAVGAAAFLVWKERYVREQATRVLFGLPKTEAILAVREWFEKIPATDPRRELALVRALQIFAAHETPNAELLRDALEADDVNARAQALLLGGRWHTRLPESFELHKDLLEAAEDEHPRIRLAALIAAGETDDYTLELVAEEVADHPQDAFLKVALKSARSISDLEKPPTAAPAKKIVPAKPAPPVPAALGTLRATPDFVAALAAEVREKGDAKRGAEVYRRQELACVICHQIGGAGGAQGPALDSIGSAQPLDFIIGAVIEPQREIKEGFETFAFTLKDGTTVLGSIVAGSQARFTLREPTGAERTLTPADFTERKAYGSLMPGALVDGLSRADLRDLFAYLGSLGKPR